MEKSVKKEAPKTAKGESQILPIPTPLEIGMINASLRTAGISLDIPSTAVVVGIIDLFKVKKDDLSIKDINNIVIRVMQDKSLNRPEQK